MLAQALVLVLVLVVVVSARPAQALLLARESARVPEPSPEEPASAPRRALGLVRALPRPAHPVEQAGPRASAQRREQQVQVLATVQPAFGSARLERIPAPRERRKQRG